MVPARLASTLAAWRTLGRACSSTWPATCEICRQWCGGALCSRCVAQFAAPVLRCGHCGLRLGLPAPACGHCRHERPPFEYTVCAVDYAFPWNRLIGAFKFHTRAELAGALAGRLLQAVHRAGVARPDIVVPIPLGARRLAERGYNQAWELARPVAAALGIAADATLLSRPLDTGPQAELDRHQRLLNLRTAFMVDPARRAEIRSRRVALVDDVMTTGATVREASATLLRAGAASVQVWALARTPEG
jgi:ComF family protein